MSSLPQDGEPLGRQRAIELLEANERVREAWPRIQEAFDSPESPAAFEWDDLDSERPLDVVLEQLARVKVIVPEDNQQTQKDGHNRTVENHIKFALEVAGTQENLALYLELLKARLEGADCPERDELARQTLLIWAPAAEINGWFGTKTELEDLAFPVLYPDEHRRIAKTYEHFGTEEEVAAAAEAYGELVQYCLQEEIPDLRGHHLKVKVRPKSYYNVWRRAQKDGRADYRLPDFIGVRAIIDYGDDEEKAGNLCYVATGVVGSIFEHDKKWIRDYITVSKPNGYRSIHLNLREDQAQLEVQIRTAEMDRQAEQDPNASHMTYEAWTKITPGRTFKHGLTKPPSSYLWREEAAQAIAERDGILAGLHPDRVLAFRQDGNLFELSAGDTMLDFAFAVQDRRALRTTGIKVDGRQVGYEKPVQFGDCIELSYDPSVPQWEESWREKTRSARARKRLRAAHKAEHAEEYRQKAQAMVEKEFASVGVEDPFGVLTEDDEREIVRRYGGPVDFETVLREIGAGEKRPDKLINHIQRCLARGQEATPDTTAELLAKRSAKAASDGEIEIPGLLGCDRHLAQCCNPKPGMAIMAAASQIRKAVTIHRADCDNLNADRAFACEWKAAA